MNARERFGESYPLFYQGLIQLDFLLCRRASEQQWILLMLALMLQRKRTTCWKRCALAV